jgi:plasmid stability protein
MKRKELAVNRRLLVMIKRRANTFFMIVQRKVLKAAKVLATTVKRWSQGKNINQKIRLQRRAARHGRSMEEEVRDILRNVVKDQDAAAGGLGTEIASLFANVGLEEDIPELRRYQTKSARCDR